MSRRFIYSGTVVQASCLPQTEGPHYADQHLLHFELTRGGLFQIIASHRQCGHHLLAYTFDRFDFSVLGDITQWVSALLREPLDALSFARQARQFVADGQINAGVFNNYKILRLIEAPGLIENQPNTENDNNACKALQHFHVEVVRTRHPKQNARVPDGELGHVAI